MLIATWIQQRPCSLPSRLLPLPPPRALDCTSSVHADALAWRTDSSRRCPPPTRPLPAVTLDLPSISICRRSRRERAASVVASCSATIRRPRADSLLPRNPSPNGGHPPGSVVAGRGQRVLSEASPHSCARAPRHSHAVVRSRTQSYAVLRRRLCAARRTSASARGGRARLVPVRLGDHL